MSNLTNNLFPPIVETWAPGFLETASARVYFGFSMYNSTSQVKNIQISVANVMTNRSELNSSLYPSGIKLSPIKLDSSKKDDYKYYVEIAPSDMEGGLFVPGKTYRVQLRFTSIEATEPPISPQIESWLNGNLSKFSEWSPVTLLSPVYMHSIYLRGFENYVEGTVANTLSETVVLSGKLVFSNANSIDTLKYYQFKIYDNINQSLLEDSQRQLSTNNEFYYEFKRLYDNSKTYKIVLEYETASGYRGTKTYLFKPTAPSTITTTFTNTVIQDRDNSFNTISIDLSVVFTGKAIIKRASSLNNFLFWENIGEISIDKKNTVKSTYTYNDYTPESGVYYKYGVQLSNSNGATALSISPTPVMLLIVDMFIMDKTGYLRLQFDQSVTTIKRIEKRVSVETLGSRYPLTRKNGIVNYRQFGIGALLSFLSDENSIFFNKKEFYKDNESLYLQFNKDLGINDYTDYIIEKAFRDKVEQFLYNGNPKLIRTGTEGNILVRLSDISLEPIQNLGRYLYRFSASANEEGPVDIASLKKNNII